MLTLNTTPSPSVGGNRTNLSAVSYCSDYSWDEDEKAEFSLDIFNFHCPVGNVGFNAPAGRSSGHDKVSEFDSSTRGDSRCDWGSSGFSSSENGSRISVWESSGHDRVSVSSLVENGLKLSAGGLSRCDEVSPRDNPSEASLLAGRPNLRRKRTISFNSKVEIKYFTAEVSFKGIQGHRIEPVQPLIHPSCQSA